MDVDANLGAVELTTYTQDIQARDKCVSSVEHAYNLQTSLIAHSAELKVLPTQPDNPTIAEEEEDGDDERERAKAELDGGEGVEVRDPLNQ